MIRLYEKNEAQAGEKVLSFHLIRMGYKILLLA